ncbi:hypothetical protein Bca101_076988 [Brassica carinata]
MYSRSDIENPSSDSHKNTNKSKEREQRDKPDRRYGCGNPSASAGKSELGGGRRLERRESNIKRESLLLFSSNDYSIKLEVVRGTKPKKEQLM